MGKTTVVRHLAELLKGRRLGGFYTAEIREAGERRGFRLLDYAGQEALIAHVTLPGPLRVGRYGVDVAAMEQAAALLDPAAPVDLFLLDEIGRMECLAPGLVAAIGRLLDSGRPLVATVAARGTGLIAAVKERPGVELVRVTRDNRDGLPALLQRRLRSVTGKG